MVTNVAGAQVSSNALLSLIAINAPVLLPALPAGGMVTLQATVDVGASYALEGSTNLIHWSALTNVTALSSPLNLTVPVNSSAPQNFYRLRSGP
jgi:capsule polysaccharide modification protein KpsS